VVTVRFLEIAEIELDDAIQWYHAQAPGLGDAFLIEVLTAADRVARHPDAWHPVEQGPPLPSRSISLRFDLCRRE